MIVLVFGATGAAGGSVLRAALADPAVTEVRAIGRRAPAFAAHPKLRVVLHNNFLEYALVGDAFRGVAGCLFCLGISVRQVSGEADYRRITRDFAIAAATVLAVESPTAVFHYLSGQGANPASRMMWARVKADAERQLIERFAATCWRPGFIDGADAANAPRLYQWLRPVVRLLRGARWLYVNGEDLGRAMLWSTPSARQQRSRIIENVEIRMLADAARGAADMGAAM